MLVVTAPAKVNLFLGVGAARPDGYHDVTTVLHALSLHDTLEISPAETLTLDCEPDLGIPAEKNLAWRAATEFSRAVGREPAVALRLRKRIPHGAGLGGGSSDAAAVIAGLASLWGLPRDDERCEAVARALGADVAFFLEPAGAALMTGRGDVIEQALRPLAGVPVALVRPETPVPTPAAYAAFD
ncbi:MAG: 4-diphosphocytidyl-2C-methyl-D-erythritol kinase, partial [Actinobacteria bacterium]